jgi:hypothetical protein
MGVRPIDGDMVDVVAGDAPRVYVRFRAPGATSRLTSRAVPLEQSGAVIGAASRHSAVLGGDVPVHSAVAELSEDVSIELWQRHGSGDLGSAR